MTFKVEHDWLTERGWAPWQDDDADATGKILLLCPLKDFENVPTGTIMRSIDGDFLPKEDVDLDTRGGYLAYGLLVPRPKKPPKKHPYRFLDDPWESSKK